MIDDGRIRAMEADERTGTARRLPSFPSFGRLEADKRLTVKTVEKVTEPTEAAKT